ncbi:MAG: DUF2141 domain-containing protein, partial [Anaerolineales bacterium]
YSSVVASHLPWQIPALVTVDNHPPLYYMLLSLVRLALGNSEWALRSLSVAGAVGLLALGAGPVRRIFGDRNAFLYGIVVLFTPSVLIYAHEARMYSLAICAVTAGALYGYLAVTGNRARDWVLFGLATLAGAYLHYYGLIAAFFLHALVFFWLCIKRRGQLKMYLIVAAVVVVAYLPWLIVFIRQTLNAHKVFWLGPLSWDGIKVAFIQPFAYKEQFPAVTFARFLSKVTLTQSLAFGWAVLLCISGLVFAWWKRADREAAFGRFVLLAYLGVVVTTILVSLFLMPLFFSRYLLVVSGLFLLLVALGMGTLPGKYLPWIAALLFAVLNVFTIRDIYTQYFNHPMRQLVETLDGAVQPNDLIITSDSYSLGPAFYYWPQAVHYYQNNPIEGQWGDVLKPFDPPLHYERDLPELLATHKTFWYITCNTDASMSITDVLKGAQGWQMVGAPVRSLEPYSTTMFTAQKYEYKGNAQTQPEGALTVHVTGLRPNRQSLIFALLNHGPVTPGETPAYVGWVKVNDPEATYTFYGLPHGDYALVILHDLNGNNALDMDPQTGMPTDGFSIVNLDKVEPSLASKQPLSFDQIKFQLDQPEMTIEAIMGYPPFGSPGE